MEPKYIPICQIIPPHILRNIAQWGTPVQQASALRGLLVSAELRQKQEVTLAQTL